jgi:hypothetical protein
LAFAWLFLLFDSPAPRFHDEVIVAKGDSATFIVPQHIWQDQNWAKYTAYNDGASPVTTGPWRLAFFAGRCPAVMARCWSEKPPLYRVNPERVARCFLYQEAPVLAHADVAETFVAPVASTG